MATPKSNDMRKNVSSGAVWEDLVGYSRAVRVGNNIEVSGTTAVEGGEVVGRNDAYVQTRCILEKIFKALVSLGAGMEDVIRTRIYVTDISQWEQIGKAHAEYFGKIKPCTSMVEVRRLISDDLLVEIEASAVIFEEPEQMDSDF